MPCLLAKLLKTYALKNKNSFSLRKAVLKSKRQSRDRRLDRQMSTSDECCVWHYYTSPFNNGYVRQLWYLSFCRRLFVWWRAVNVWGCEICFSLFHYLSQLASIWSRPGGLLSNSTKQLRPTTVASLISRILKHPEVIHLNGFLNGRVCKR